MNRLPSLLLALAACTSTGNAFAAPGTAAFVGNPQIDSLKISPAGTYLAMASRSGSEAVMTVLKYSDMSVSAHTNLGDFEHIDAVEWANDSRLLIHRSDETRAPIEHAKRLRAGMVDADNPPLWINTGNDEHGMNNEADRVAIYDKMLAFFGTNLGAGSAAAPTAK